MTSGDQAFIRWARRHVTVIYDCVWCGAPTRHESRMCPIHRDLLQSVDESVDRSLDQSTGELLEGGLGDRVPDPDRVARG